MRISSVLADIIQISNRDHGDLQGLSTDDHTIYLDVAGSRPPKNIRFGAIADIPATCSVGEFYFATDEGKLYCSVVTDNWTEVTPKTHHSRHAVGGGDVLTASQMAGLMALIGTTQGDILIRGASTIERLASGNSGNILTSKGSGVKPEWAVGGVKAGASASATLRNSNDAEKTLENTSWTKVKEVELNADLKACRLKCNFYTIFNVTGGDALEVRKNGVLIGSTISYGDPAWHQVDQDFEGFNSGDLIQIWLKSKYTGGGPCKVKEMRFCYDQLFTEVGGYTITTPIALDGDPTISMTNQDP